MRVLILGGTGMLGHKLAEVLTGEFETIVALRDEAANWLGRIPASQLVGGVDVSDPDGLARLLDEYRPAVVVNAVGVVKQVIDDGERARTIAINALFPNLLAELCAVRKARLIHFSTDCVFSGEAQSVRGQNGYREADPPDARDLYGLSKLLGEPSGTGVLVLRTSMIGRELRGRFGLLEWFLAQETDAVKGYTRALFTGLTTLELARVTGMLLRDHADLAGMWHLAADPISKCALLGLVRDAYGRKTTILPDDEYYCDRRLDGARLAAKTGWRAPPWPELVEAMRNDPSDRL